MAAQYEVKDPIGFAEIAEICKVKLNTAHFYFYRSRDRGFPPELMPAPKFYVGDRPVFERAEIEEWNENRPGPGNRIKGPGRHRGYEVSQQPSA